MTTLTHRTDGEGFRPAGGLPHGVTDADAAAVALGWADSGFHRLAMAEVELIDVTGVTEREVTRPLRTGSEGLTNGVRTHVPDLPPVS